MPREAFKRCDIDSINIVISFSLSSYGFGVLQRSELRRLGDLHKAGQDFRYIANGAASALRVNLRTLNKLPLYSSKSEH
jgi:hypothetical protein